MTTLLHELSRHINYQNLSVVKNSYNFFFQNGLFCKPNDHFSKSVNRQRKSLSYLMKKVLHLYI